MFQRLIKVVLILILSFSFVNSYPRAGGSGGDDDESSYSSSDDNSDDSYSSSSSSSDDDDDNYSYSSDDTDSGGSGGKSNPIVTGVIIGVIALIMIIGLISSALQKRKEKKKIAQLLNDKNKIPDQKKVLNEAFLLANPGFDEKEFKSKVKTAFFQIQEAWYHQNLSKVRKWISDGIYQRFNLQIEMMKKLGQINILTDVEASSINLIKVESEGTYSTLTVLISFSMDDEFNCSKMPELNANYKGTKASEYWTFVKRSGQTKGNLYDSNECPNCGATLNSDSGEVSKCGSCGTITYLGEYDWVLADITQKNDYKRDQSGLTQTSAVFNEIKKEENFCLQLLEDKAANAFINILTAHATGHADRLYRCVSDEVIASTKNESPYLFNRLYVINVLPAFFESVNGKHSIMFKIAYGAQRVKLDNDNVIKLDNDLIKTEGYLTLSRKAGGVNSKSQHWSYECSYCGNPFDDTTLNKCNNCNATINSGEQDWIVSKTQNLL